VTFLLVSIAAAYLFFVLLDFLAPARTFPSVALWRVRGALATVLYFTVAFTAPVLWDGWLAQRTLFDASVLPLWSQILGGVLVVEFGIYVWHRTMHQTDFIWRHVHQFHHSAERVDIWGSYWFHPFDMLGWTFLGSLCLVGVFGVSLEAAIAANLITTLLGMFGHVNIKTPHWLGYFISRPEMHAIHHERGVHFYNFSDLPVFDMMFGTYRNPKTWEAQAGFYEGASNQVLDLLVGKKLA
jgi:sterol desaturase/sphingolipid hydroxylase (fatty acid hydroxylase superfamily)